MFAQAHAAATAAAVFVWAATAYDARFLRLLVSAAASAAAAAIQVYVITQGTPSEWLP